MLNFFLIVLFLVAMTQGKISLDITFTSPIYEYGEARVTWNVSEHVIVPGRDWVSMWWEPFHATYVEFVNVTEPTGSVLFPVLNARHGYYARYFSGDDVLAQTNPIYPEASFPTQLRLSLPDDDPTHVMISWTSNRTITGQTMLWYGKDKSLLDQTISSFNISTYTHVELNQRVKLPPLPVRNSSFPNISSRNIRCADGSCWDDFTATELFVDPGVFINVFVAGLIPGTTYFYRVGEKDGHQSTVRSFTTRVPRAPNAQVQILYTADAGIGQPIGGLAGGATHNDIPVNGANFVWNALLRDTFLQNDTVMIINGDVSYARGWPYIWEVFGNQTSHGIMDQRPTMVTFGNHEFDFGQNPFQLCNGGDSGGEAGIPTARRYALASLSQPWYYRTVGSVFMIFLSSEHSVTEQVYWLKNSVFGGKHAFNRTETPWLVVNTHRPIFTSNYGELVGSIALQVEYLEYADLFTEVGVDVVLTGHAHFYERLCSISSASCATWGFRDVWRKFEMSTVTSKNPSCFLDGGNRLALEVLACRSNCASNETCTGVIWSQSKLSCTILTCPLSEYQLGWDADSIVLHLNKFPGKPPVYVVDGSAGAEFSPLQTPQCPWTEYKEFKQWGYSRLFANETHLQWKHYHLDNTVADEVTLTRSD